MACREVLQSNLCSPIMPIAYECDDLRQLITVTVTEPVTLDEIRDVIDRQAAEDTWDYAMLFDLRRVKDASVLAHLPQIADRVKELGGDLEARPGGRRDCPAARSVRGGSDVCGAHTGADGDREC